MIQRLSDKKPFCKYCLGEGHSAFSCSRKPRKAMQTRSTLKTTTRLKPVGKQGKKTANYVAAWKRTQKPNHQGLYKCYISGRLVPYLMAEHPYSKVRHPELRTNQTLEPVSAEINKLKGSMDISDFLEKYPEYKATVKRKYLVSNPTT